MNFAPFAYLDKRVSAAPPYVIPINTSGLTIYVDSNTSLSYSGGTTWFSLVTGSTFNATLNNGPTFNSGTPSFFSFDGTNDFGDFGGSSAGSDAQSWSWGLWFRVNQSAGDRILVQRGFDGSGSGFSIATYKDTNNRLSHFVVLGTTGAQSQGTTTLQNNTWYYGSGVFTYGATQSVRLYLNGNLERTTSRPANVALRDSTVGWRMGVGNGPTYYPSNISTFELYNRALSDAEILSNFNATKSLYGY
jgi:hypothetical protein